jgi:hypothetical protein
MEVFLQESLFLMFRVPFVYLKNAISKNKWENKETPQQKQRPFQRIQQK